jgi:hypothetical protein
LVGCPNWSDFHKELALEIIGPIVHETEIRHNYTYVNG